MSDMSNPTKTGWTYNLYNPYTCYCRQGRSVAHSAYPFPAALPALGTSVRPAEVLPA
jgi:hypothetical protein